ncbi:EAL domain-containing protein [Hoeflea sp. YIM 152468]|uniref:putative bifunctional diguanylate cyclase/phosphodiesterase n=1 Tax=Hoeflea sp. YIM 152468 TaxID=3031759 RepID=UPI0023DABFA5|nr:EAL domain-containing protein [Hoeflea sp. YIM 152468]MDF1609565.1 EAL domain-containing protein [Hoeflea sp. YIM 152468]
MSQLPSQCDQPGPASGNQSGVSSALTKLLALFRTTNDPARQQAIAKAYVPILRPILIPASVYYIYVTWEHWQTQTGLILAIYCFISATTAVSYYLFRRYLLGNERVTLGQLELVNLAINLLIYINVLSYLLVYNEQARYIYFVLMAVIFSITGATLRVVLFSVFLSLTTLYFLAWSLPDERLAEYVSICVATAFASISMSALLRSAILRQIDARLLADDLTAKAQRLADTDMLTGIPNRRAIFQKIDDLISERRPFWMGIFDLDGFKAINDVYGHILGDNLLCAIVERVGNLDLPDTTFGRIGGDEFVVIVQGTLCEEEIRRFGTSVIDAISRPYPIDHMALSVGVSAGLSHFPAMGSTGAQLYEKADYALFKAKAQLGGQCFLFDTAEDAEMKQAIAIERALREGNLETELYLLFQPQFSPRQQRVVGFEALARWHSPKLGLVRPDQFIRAAERSGHIRRVSTILFKQGLKRLAEWPPDISLSFNLSGQDISDRSFILSLLGQIMRSGISPSRIEFEITETAVMTDIETSKTLLEELRASGCKIALDDFGSGYSSFEYLDQLPLDKVKIDRSFIRKVSHNTKTREIVAGIIGLCSKLDLRCVLEGVETRDEMNILAELQPDLIQGYLYGRPMPAEAALQVIRDQDSRLGDGSVPHAQSA